MPLLNPIYRTYPSACCRLERPKEPEIEIISTKVTEEDEKDAWKDEFGVKYSKDGKKLIDWKYRYLTNYTIRQGTRSICDGAFYGCSSLQSVTIPDSVICIGDWAFCGCKFLHSVTIPDSVTSIGNGAFYDCSSLHSVIISHKTYDRLKVNLQDYSSKIKFTD